VNPIIIISNQTSAATVGEGGGHKSQGQGNSLLSGPCLSVDT
jgi:hypothetical protein